MTIAITSSGGVTGSGPALSFYTSLLAALPSLGIPAGADGVTAKTQIANVANAVEAAVGQFVPSEIVEVPDTTLTLTVAHKFKYLRFTNAAGCTVTVPSGVFAKDEWINLRAAAAGQVVLVASGTTLIPPAGYTEALAALGSTASMEFFSDTVVDLTGSLEAA